VEELEAFRWPATAWDRSPLEKTRWRRSSSGLVLNSSGLGSQVGSWCAPVGVYCIPGLLAGPAQM
jgi:hypothetical protein